MRPSWKLLTTMDHDEFDSLGAHLRPMYETGFLTESEYEYARNVIGGNAGLAYAIAENLNDTNHDYLGAVTGYIKTGVGPEVSEHEVDGHGRHLATTLADWRLMADYVKGLPPSTRFTPDVGQAVVAAQSQPLLIEAMEGYEANVLRAPTGGPTQTFTVKYHSRYPSNFQMTENGIREWGLTIAKQTVTRGEAAESGKVLKLSTTIPAPFKVVATMTNEKNERTFAEVTAAAHNYLSIDDLAAGDWVVTIVDPPPPPPPPAEEEATE